MQQPVFVTVHNGEGYYNPKSLELIAQMGSCARETRIFSSAEEATQKLSGKNKYLVLLVDDYEENRPRFHAVPLAEAGELAKQIGARRVFKVGATSSSKRKHKLAVDLRDAAHKQITSPNHDLDQHKTHRNSRRRRDSVGRLHFYQKYKAERYHAH